MLEQILCQHAFWHAQWKGLHIIMANVVDSENIIPVTMDKLIDDQRQQVEQRTRDFQKLCLESFSMTQQGLFRNPNSQE